MAYTAEQCNSCVSRIIEGDKTAGTPADLRRYHDEGTAENAGSENHGPITVTPDGWRAFFGWPSIWTLQKSLDWMADWLEKQAAA